MGLLAVNDVEFLAVNDQPLDALLLDGILQKPLILLVKDITQGVGSTKDTVITSKQTCPYGPAVHIVLCRCNVRDGG